MKMRDQFENVCALLKPGVIGFRNLVTMRAEEKLRNRLISMIQELSMSKLTELGLVLKKITERCKKSKERTLKMAGVWNDLDEELFLDLTERLHERRLNDRQPVDW
jgi:hypothetical protein